MTLHIHKLTGCSPAPLALYLKALGILRIVSEQADSEARGWWQDEHFCLMTKLDVSALETFFLKEYSPTPFLSPWNKGCGFFKENDKGMAPIEASQAERFADFRHGIAVARGLLEDVSNADAAIRAIKDRTKTNKSFQSPEQRSHLRQSAAYRTTLRNVRDAMRAEGIDEVAKAALQAEAETLEFLVSDADKPPTKKEADHLKKQDGYKRISRVADKFFKARKAALIPDCRRSWRGRHADWMAAGIVLDENNEPKYPSLLGTGGNDGNMDFTNNAMQRLGELFDMNSENGVPREGTRELLCEAFWDQPSNALDANAIGQFLPGSGGGANSDTGPDGSPMVNAWDFVLMMEGTLLFAGRITRRTEANSRTSTSAPFALHAHAAGHATPGDEKDIRGEQWMPLWSQPSTFRDVTALLSDGRMRLKRENVNRPIDAARAISRLGVARGIDSFVRYGYLERNGQSTLAVPLGRVGVRANPRSRLVDDLANWMNSLQRLARESHAPARLLHGERRLADAVFGALTHDYTADRWRLILEAAADLEAIQAAGTGFSAGPIPKLKPEWVSAVYDVQDDTSAREVRLALALAGGTWKEKTYWPVRHHFLPLKPGGLYYDTKDKRLADDPQVVATGRDAVADCGGIVLRRFIDAPETAGGYFPLKAEAYTGAALSDLAALIDGHVDLSRVVKLGRAFMALDWKAWRKDGKQYFPRFHPGDEHPEEAWLAIRLACLPYEVKEFKIKAEHSMVRRLLAGDGAAAAQIAKRRLAATGLRVPFAAAFADDHTSSLWAAALAFPISTSTAEKAIEKLFPNSSGESHA